MTLSISAYWQSPPNDATLLLQQYQYAHTQLALICLCAGYNESSGKAGAYLTGQLLQWFRRLPWKKLVKDPEYQLFRIASQFNNTIERIDDELISGGLLPTNMQIDLTGILCVGEYFLLFHRGEQKIFMLNRNLTRGYISPFDISPESGSFAAWEESDRFDSQENTLILQQGMIQRDAGILLATDSLCKHVTLKEMGECLNVTELFTETQADRHLQELGRQGEALGGRNMGAVLLLAREKREKNF